MIKTTHTPGPWYAYKNRNPTGEGCDYTIATVPTEDKDLGDDGTDYTIAGIWSNKAVDEANANLIAAAPELLKAVELADALLNQIFPQIGKLCVDIGKLNDYFLLTGKLSDRLIKQAKGE